MELLYLTPINAILINLATILAVGTVYFIIKEIYRIQNNTFNNAQIAIVGTLLGIFVLIIYLFVSMQVSWTVTEVPKQSLTYNMTYLSPTIIIVILFGVMFDRRLIVPMMIFQIIAYIISVKNADGILSEIESWTKMLYEFLTYLIISILVYLGSSNILVKKNGRRLIYILIIYVFISIFADLLYAATIIPSITGSTSSEIIAIVELMGVRVIYYIIYMIILGSMIWVIEKVYSNFNDLETFSTQDDVSYYKISLAQNKLRKIIDEEKINMGALVLFDIKTQDTEIKSRILNNIRLGTNIKYESSFFFKATSQLYGAFYQLDEDFSPEQTLINNKKNVRGVNDELHYVTDVIKEIVLEEDVQITSSASIYGVHSYDVNELIEYCKFLMTPIISRANKNTLIVYDFKRVKDRLKERSNVMNLPIDIETIKIQYLRGIYSKPTYYALIEFDTLDGQKRELAPEFINSLHKNERETLMRYIAYQTMREFDNAEASLVVFYSTDYLSSKEFDLPDFIKKVKRYTKIDKIIIGLSISKNSANKQFKANVEELRKQKVRFALLNPVTATQEEHDMLMPEFILEIDNEINPFKIVKKKIKIKTDATPLNTNLV